MSSSSSCAIRRAIAGPISPSAASCARGARSSSSANLSARVLERDPRHALAVAELAVAIAEGITEHTYPPVVITQLRAHAWKDVGQALAYLGRHQEALHALDQAEGHVMRFGALAHDLAIVRFVRATTLQEIDRHDESFALLAECKEVFRDHGDQRRLLLCGIAHAVLLHRLRKYREAREVYLLLLSGTRDTIDREAEACLNNVIGHCSVDLGDYDAAELHLARAVRLFDELDQPMQAAKAELGRGRVLVRTGHVTRGIDHLRAIRSRFMRHGMTEEAGLCGLEIVEAMLVRGDAAEAETLARRIIAEFTAASLNTRAITALGFLSEAIAARKASAAMVSNVREYIASRSGGLRSESSLQSRLRNGEAVSIENLDDFLDDLDDHGVAAPLPIALPRRCRRVHRQSCDHRNRSHTTT